MTTPGMDVNMAVQTAGQDELIRKSIGIKQLRQRLGDTRTEEERLQEVCENFESIFVQKMWEQMRKTVPKEGYLHSKDEETYQSMFDIELAKKMTEAGGIGLADMLYEQLSQKLTSTARTTSPQGGGRPFSPEAAQAQAGVAAPVAVPIAGSQELTPDFLYSPLPVGEDPAAADMKQEHAPKTVVDAALDDLRKSLEAEEAARQEVPLAAAHQSAAVAGVSIPAETSAAVFNASDIQAVEQKRHSDLRASSWRGTGPVSAKPQPLSRSGRSQAARAAADASTATEQSGVWPHQGDIVSRFGWEGGSQSQEKRWNSGVRIAAHPGDPVKASMDGKVVYNGVREGYGNTIVLQHDNGYMTYYGNVEGSQVQVGDTVQSGMEFAKVSAAAPTASNEANFAPLHFEIKRGEMALNPEMAIRYLVSEAEKQT